MEEPAFVKWDVRMIKATANEKAATMVAVFRKGRDLTITEIRLFAHAILAASLFLRGWNFSMLDCEGFNIVVCDRSLENCPMIP